MACKRFKKSSHHCQVTALAMSQPEIVERTLSFLSAGDILFGSAAVSREWHRLSMKALEKRKGSSFLIFSESSLPSDVEDEAFLPGVSNFLFKSYFYPRKVFVVTSKKFQASVKYIRENCTRVCYTEMYKFSNHRMMSYFLRREVVPKHSELYCVSSVGIFGCSTESYGDRYVNVLREKGALAIAFSEAISQNVHFYSLPPSMANEELTEECLRNCLNVPPSKPLKFMLYLAAQHGDFPVVLLGKIFELCPDIAVTGALVDNHSLYDSNCQSKISSDCITGIAISGHHVSCSSLVLTDQFMGRDDIERQVSQFRSQVGELSADCWAFLVFCLARNTDADIRIFRTYFPGVTAVGIYAYGEFGRNVIEGCCHDRRQTYDHSYSTIISIINFKSNNTS